MDNEGIIAAIKGIFHKYGLEIILGIKENIKSDIEARE